MATERDFIMIKSMTGYGRSQQTLNGRDITVELKAVNHRYFEYTSRMPRAYNYLDDKLKKLVQAFVARGKIDLGLTIGNVDGSTTSVVINTELAEEYLTALRGMGQTLGVTDDVTLTTLSRFNDIFTVSKVVEDEEQVWADVSSVAEQAVKNFVEMRTLEGKKLSDDIFARLLQIENSTSFVEERSPKTVAEYRARLTSKLVDILGSNTLDEQRMMTEVAMIGEKLAVDEETVRLRSHISQLRDILTQGGTVGRKLDFLVQEINREINTIGSKSQDVDIARVVVDTKSEVEKIREQIQNIE